MLVASDWHLDIGVIWRQLGREYEMNDIAIDDNENDIDGLDSSEDPSGGFSGWNKPWDPQKIRVTTKNFSLREIVTQIGLKDIDLSPDFQREFVWKPRQQTRLIESVLLGIPLPAFYFDQGPDGSYQVVDGVQRLTTVNQFMNNKHVLKEVDIEYLKNLAGKSFEDLDRILKRRFSAAQIVVHVIEPQTPDEVKFDIFSRVNTLGSPLSAQEIRHAMSGKRSKDFLKKLVENKLFDKATKNRYWRKNADGKLVRNSARMADRQLALRFCAFRYCSIDEYRKYASLDAFLMHFTRQIDGDDEATRIDDAALDQLKRDFFNAMDAAHKILEDAAFRRGLGAERSGPINRAVFEAQANALADYPVKQLLRYKDKIKDAFRGAFNDPEYAKSVTVGTGSPVRAAFRLEKTKTLLSEAMS